MNTTSLDRNVQSFDNPKDVLEYMKTKAKKGETIILDERATFTHPRRIKRFTK